MQSNTGTNLQLIEIVKLQEKTIEKQNELLAKLVNENAEKENFINVLVNETK